MKRKRIKLSEQIRQAIDGCGMTRYQISHDTGIDQATLCRFMRDNGGLSIPVLDRLGEYLGLELRPVGKSKGGCKGDTKKGR